MKLIYLEWADATSPDGRSWWYEEDALEWAREDDYWISQSGWLLEETKEYILIAGAASDLKSSGITKSYAHLQKIPKTWIRKRQIIKLK